MLPRGIRNNNPGNIELGDPWQGLSAQQTDGRFAQFDSPEYGIRAMARVLDNYQTKHGLRTPRAMIARWAPSSENDVGSYVRSVAKQSGLNPDAPIDLARDGDKLIAAMIQHENGQQPFDFDTIRRGIEMAGVQVAQSGGQWSPEQMQALEAARARLQGGSQPQAPQFSPEQQAALDAARARLSGAPAVAAAEPASSESQMPPGMVLLENGYVLDTKAAAEHQARAGGGHTAGLAGSFLKGVPFVGEFADEAIGAIDEALGGTPGLKREQARAAVEQFEKDHPGQALTANLVGGVAATGPAVVAAAPKIAAVAPTSMGGKVLVGAGAGATAGAVEGAVSGFGAGEGDKRAEAAGDRALMGGLIGGPLGAAAPAISKGASSLVRRIKSRPDADLARELSASPESVEIVGRMLQNDGPDALRNVRAAGGGGMIADAGPATAGLLDAAIQRAGPGGRIARDAIGDRAAAAGRDIDSALDQFLGKSTGVKAAAREISQRSAAIREKAYDKAFASPIDYAAGAGRAIEDVVAKIPARTLRAAIQDANEEMVSRGLKNEQILAEIAEDGSVVFREMPNVRQLDQIKQALDRAGSAQDVFGRPTQEALRPRRLARELRAALGKAVPAYDRAVKLGGQKIAEDQALQTGRRILSRAFTREDVADALESANTAELRAARTGLRRQIDEVIKNTKTALTDPNMDAREGVKAFKELSSAAVREKVEVVLGPKAAKSLFDRIDRASKAFELRARTADNSKTFARQNMDGAIKDLTEPGALSSLLQGSPAQAARRMVQDMTKMTPQARRDLEERISGEIASILTTDRGADAAGRVEAMVRLLERQPATEALAQRIGQIVAATSAGGVYHTTTQTLAR